MDFIQSEVHLPVRNVGEYIFDLMDACNIVQCELQTPKLEAGLPTDAWVLFGGFLRIRAGDVEWY